MPRILLADDHALMRRGMRSLLEAEEDWEVCAEAATGREAVDLAVKLNPDVAVLDLSMPELTGLEAAKEILEKVPQVEEVEFHHARDGRAMREVLASGARGCVLKTDIEQHLVAAVSAALQHSVYFSSKASEALKGALMNKEAADPAAPDLLTEREREVVQLLAQAKTNKEIAAALDISVRTVETHRATIMRKLEINSIVELVRYAVRKKLVQIKDEQ